ncbi:nucleotide exchange factor GrpE [Priestia megaterium]|uniref:nucleotide exchange factor GrpE n=1 Tax=Priestia megaterium TaxID=1404 RepID=UPI002E240A14|nr:nucleotide exchange factor GrpE [Priestia megaterium]MED4239067.1 nucleotide exchange factor GrpE [Priestia megaterium]MED4251689.1 nucleotide exchange factor GrpE [Priestia megaterium]
MSNEKQVEGQNEEVVEEVQTDSAEATEAEVSEEVNPLQQENDQLKQQLEEEENRYLRLQADFDNFRRRSRLDAEAAQKYRAQSLVSDILPALDNFERALQVNTADEQTKSVLQGVEMVYRQLVEALQKEGVEAIESVGKKFDPYLHQAVMQVEDDEYEPNTVVEELQKGYKLKDKIIRPAMVKVNQ